MIKLTFVGTGVSCAIPVIGHFTTSCACDEAIRCHDSPNRRNNVSLMITLTHKTATHNDCTSDKIKHRSVNILIDAGKTFRDAYFRVLAPLHVRYVDALLLTHGHADAMQCVEQVCELHSQTYHCMLEQQNEQQKDINTSSAHNTKQIKRCLQWIPTYLTQPTLQELQRISPQVVQTAIYHADTTDSNKGKNKNTLAVDSNQTASETSIHSNLQLHIVSQTKPEMLHIAAIQQFMQQLIATEYEKNGITIECKSDNNVATQSNQFYFYSLPVQHGTNYISLGFVFGSGVAFRNAHASQSSVAGKSCVVYISDVSTIIESSMSFLRDLVKIDVLIIDCLAGKGRQSPPHTCWDDLMPIFRVLAPVQVYCVGMFCSLQHHTSNALWASDLHAEKLRVMQLKDTQCNQNHDNDNDDNISSEQNALRFVQRCEFIKLAYDGMQLDLPL